MDPFPLPGVLRRIRRTADWSQRELAEQVGASRATVAAAERGTRDLPVALLARIATAAGGRLTVLDAHGNEVVPMADDAVRDHAGRRFPAHLDTRHGDQAWWHGEERYSRVQPWYTFDRVRETRDHWRERLGVPDDHQLPQPGDSPAERRAQRQAAARRRHLEETERRREAGQLPRSEEWTCRCPAACDYDEERNPDLRHADACECRCDV